MYRLSAIIAVAGIAFSLSAGAARAECLERVLACERICPDLQAQTTGKCKLTCRRVFICEVDPNWNRGVRNALPASVLLGDMLPLGRLPADRLPGGRMPGDKLPN